jgi:hypothetical protein
MEDVTRPVKTPLFASVSWNIPFPAPCQMRVSGVPEVGFGPHAAIDFFRGVW